MNELNIDKFTKALSEILSRKYDAKITITAERKVKADNGRTKAVLLDQA